MTLATGGQRRSASCWPPAIAAAVAMIRQRQADRIAELSKLADGRPAGGAAAARPAGGLARGGRPLHLGHRGRRHRRRPLRGARHAVRRADHHRRRARQGPRRGPPASIVLGSYRHVAYERADLRAIVADLDRAVARSVGDEDFVTAALVEERGGTLTIVNCGHPAPLLLRRGEVIPLDPPAPAPPLGFMPVVRPRVERLEPGDRLLLFTDGLGEARRDGEFFPIADRAWRLLGHGTVGDGLASLETALVEWVHGRLDDDIAAGPAGVRRAERPVTTATVPSWEVGAAELTQRRRRPARPAAGHGDSGRTMRGSVGRAVPADVARRVAGSRSRARDGRESSGPPAYVRRRSAARVTDQRPPDGYGDATVGVATCTCPIFDPHKPIRSREMGALST